ncbi:MAG TPA: LLM class flavin-dependent oxidoreductase, partial [Dehalococcoidia bacterium]|nr:LLM class flavin-dependent oxidoreductase [Dehalococcoidia bacterium]
MKFGIFDHVERLRNIPLDQQYSERLDLLAQADKGEIYGYHVAEHHHSPLSMIPSQAPYLAAVA